MKGSEGKFVYYMKGSDKRFIIPVYQRNYDWNDNVPGNSPIPLS